MPKLRNFSGLIKSLESTKRYNAQPTIEVPDEYILEVLNEEEWMEDEVPKPPPPPPGPATG